MKQKIISFIIVLAGAVFLIFPLSEIIHSGKIRNQGNTTEGTVISIERLGNKTELRKVTVSFNISDGTQVTASASKRGFVAVGDKVKVYFDTANPQEIDFGDSIGYNMRGALIGGFFLFLGLYYFIRYSLREKAIKNLINSGKKIPAELVSVSRNEKYRMGEKNPWVIKCKWTDEKNNDYYFVSRDYIIDPAQFLGGRSHIDVYIDPSDPGKYHMDTSFMPKGNNTMG